MQKLGSVKSSNSPNAQIAKHHVHGFAPNWAFNADANIGHAFGIFMAYVGTLRTSCSGAG